MRQKDGLPMGGREDEQTFVGSILKDPSKLARFRPLVQLDMFGDKRNGRIWQAICAMADSGEQFEEDPFRQVHERLGRNRDLGVYVHDVMGLASAVTNSGTYFERVVEAHRRRQLLAIGTDLRAKALSSAQSSVELVQSVNGALSAIGPVGIDEGSDGTALDVLDDFHWIWPGWLCGGVLNLLVAEKGTGKSVLALWLMRLLYEGADFLDGTGFEGGVGPTVWVETEHAQPIIKKRLGTFRIDKRRILFAKRDVLAPMRIDNPADLALIRRKAEKENARLIIMDSLSGGHRGRENDESSMLPIMSNLVVLARDTGAAVFALHHVRKRRQDERLELTLDRLRGSSGIGQLARHVLALQPAPGRRPDSKLLQLSVLVTNICEEPQPIGVEFDFEAGQVLLSSEGVCERKVYEAGIRRCEAWLASLLSERELTTDVIRPSAVEAGFVDWRMVQRAATNLGVEREAKGRYAAWRLQM